MFLMQQNRKLLPDRFSLREYRLLKNVMLDVVGQFAPTGQNGFAQRAGQLVFIMSDYVHRCALQKAYVRQRRQNATVPARGY
jgi:hypothetical protein